MNDESLDDELDLGVEKASAPWKKILIIVFAVLLLIGIGVGAAYFIFAPSDEGKSEETVTQDGEQEVEEEKGPAIYQSFKPVFVVNLSSDGKRKGRMLQIGVQALMHSQELVNFLKHNDPMIRHHFLKLFGNRTASELSSLEGKEKLQADLLEELQRIIDEQGGPGTVEAVFFTSFVMQ
ncbi:flagellar basal body-associated protein FliL [Pseudomonadota bacterium]